jgi:hypothetical protein
MSVSQTKADSYTAPMAVAEGTDGSIRNNVIRRPTSTANTSEALNSDTMQDGVTRVVWAGKYVNIRNEDTSNPVEFAFSAAAQTLVYGQTGTFAAGNAASGWRLAAGEQMSVIVPPTAAFVNWIQPAAAAASTIAFYVSEGPAIIR